MKNYEELDSIEEALEELLDKSEKILGYKSYDVNQIVNDLLFFNTDISNALANDILDFKDEMITTINENDDDDFYEDDPFNNLKDDDVLYQ